MSDYQPVDLDEARTVLADNGIDGPDLPYNPRALHAMRIADALLAEVVWLRAHTDDVYRDGYRTGHDHGTNKGRIDAAGE